MLSRFDPCPWLLLSMLALGGCRDDGPAADLGPAAEDDATCTPGASIACECEGGAAGAQLCEEDGAGWAACECIGSCALPSAGEAPLRRLTRSQYANTVRDLLGVDSSTVTESLAPDERVGPFKSNIKAPIVELQVEQYMDAGERLADAATDDLDALLPCSATPQTEDDCAEQFARQLAPRAYRRPVDEEEIQQLLDVYATTRARADFEAGVRVMVQTVLQSPYFLYHVELGAAEESAIEGVALPLTAHEYAARLSYFLWDTMPDEALRDAALAGDLDDAQGRTEQVERMLSDPRAAAGIAQFHLQWLGVDELESKSKSAEAHPQYDDRLARAMMDETAAFAVHVLTQDDARVETLLTAPYTLTTDETLLDVYGVSRPAGHVAGEPISLPDAERSGLLTQAGFLAAHAHQSQSSPVLRGVVLRQNVLCQPLPAPPDNVDNVPPDPDPDATTRERFSEHTENPECAGCHELIDPLGFGLEGYDAIGAFRREEGGRPVDATGELVATDVDGPFDGAVEMAGRLAVSEDVRDCVGTQWIRFGLGRVETEADQCTTDALLADLEASDGDVRRLVAQIALSDSFRHMAPPQ